jgi:NitT/TauT family transport system permease protein
MKLWRLWLYRLAPFLAVVAFFALWKLYVEGYRVSAYILPPPEKIAIALVKLLQEPTIGKHIRVTVTETLSGFGLAIVFGVGLGALMGKVRWIERTFRPFVIATQMVPKIALAPLFILWFGFGLESKIVISAVLAFFPIFSNTLIGIKSVDHGLREVMTTFNAGSIATFWLLEIRAALPYVLTGMEVGIVLAIIGAIVGEFMGGSEGLGNLAVVTLQELQVDTLFAVVLLLAAIGITLYLAVTMLRRWLTPWHESVSVEERP